MCQTLAGYTATCGSIAGDLMIFAVALQVIMHYDRLSKALREFKLQVLNEPNGVNEDLRKLQSLIANHIDILRLTDVMNEVFGVPLLLNFLASSLLVCLVGFQLTIAFNPEYFCKQVLLLTSALVEIYLLCYFSQMLMDAVC
ncbi:GD14189 [Drosophila simulans]|uniref:GD14189 n=1 Tax=Drosophila simulans TaxID=7240 RepID=B4QN86_DROSI|nr:GD14189 [Drosophila simulans]